MDLESLKEVEFEIVNKLTNKNFDVSLYKVELEEEIKIKTDAIYNSFCRRNRSYDEVKTNVSTGEKCELAISKLLETTIDNNEEVTDEYYWDIMFKNAKIEIKNVGLTNNWVSWASNRYTKFMMDNLEEIDLFIFCKSNRDIIYPWMLYNREGIRKSFVASSFSGAFLNHKKKNMIRNKDYFILNNI